MRQFNLEEYLKNPTREVITRDGNSVRILCTNAKGNFPIIALVNYDDSEKYYGYTACGKININQDIDCDLDLFFVPEKKEGWINLYKINSTTSAGEVYNTEKEAKSVVVGTSIYISTIKIEWEE